MSELMSLKITIEHDANYLLFGDRICRDINELDTFCKNRYQDLLKTVDHFRYFWIDDDGDEIRITTDEDYQSFLQAMANTKARLYVVGKKTTLVETSTTDEPAEPEDEPMQTRATSDDISSRPVHQYAICDVCDERIVGHRYKCLTCHDYDLCMSCEAKYRHKDHLMLRIPKPSMVDRSQSTVSRMLDKLRVYSVRITSNVEKEIPEAETGGPTSNETAEAYGSKRANARSVHRSKHSEERRTNETAKPSRGSKSSGNDRKHHSCAVGETFSKRSSKGPEEKPTGGCPALSKAAQQYRDMLLMYLNSADTIDSAGKSGPWSASDHVSVAKVAAATAAAAAARASAIASKVMESNLTVQNDKPQETAAPSSQEMEQMLRQNVAQIQQKQATCDQQQPSAMSPMAFLPFVNLSWPTPEKLMVASENVSKLLDPLGLSFEIRHKTTASPSTSGAKGRDGENGTVPSTSATVAETAEPLVQQRKNQDNTTAPSVAEPSHNVEQHANTVVPVGADLTAEKDKETAKTNTGDKVERIIPITLESDFAGEKKPEAEAENEMDDEEDSQNTSSASLLTDDDQDLLEVAQDDLQAACSSKPPTKAEKAWTLIDLPEEHDEERIANAPLDAIAKLIGRDLSSPNKEQLQPKSLPMSSKEKKKDNPLVENLKESKKATSSMPTSVTRDDETEMYRKILDEHTEKPERSVEADKQQSPSSTAKDVKPSSSSGSGGRSGKSSRKSSSAHQKDDTIYSSRPHVNHAIHTMMTMGFSNHNGWLTQLLESLNGDIPKALDLLLQHRH
uniref:ZZ-type domain-containing protein n=1 Tax=Anopheles culicifacies TaxID=139723 RepID=A0A182MUY3_9DIPT